MRSLTTQKAMMETSASHLPLPPLPFTTVRAEPLAFADDQLINCAKQRGQRKYRRQILKADDTFSSLEHSSRFLSGCASDIVRNMITIAAVVAVVSIPNRSNPQALSSSCQSSCTDSNISSPQSSSSSSSVKHGDGCRQPQGHVGSTSLPSSFLNVLSSSPLPFFSSTRSMTPAPLVSPLIFSPQPSSFEHDNVLSSACRITSLGLGWMRTVLSNAFFSLSKEEEGDDAAFSSFPFIRGALGAIQNPNIDFTNETNRYTAANLPAGKTSMNLCFMIWGQVEDKGYSEMTQQGMLRAVRALEEKYSGKGIHPQVTFRSEITSRNADYIGNEAAMRSRLDKMVNDNDCDYLFASFYDFAPVAWLKEYALARPDMLVMLGSVGGYESGLPSNFITAEPLCDREWYLAGIVAGGMTTKCVGLIAPFDSVTMYYPHAFAKGIARGRSVNTHASNVSQVELTTAVVGDWRKPERDVVVADMLMKPFPQGVGCSVIAGYTNSAASTERGIAYGYSIGWEFNRLDSYGNKVLASVIRTFDDEIFTTVEYWMYGQTKGQQQYFQCEVSPLSPLISTEVRDLFNTALNNYDAIRDVWGDDLYDQSNVKRVQGPVSDPLVRLNLDFITSLSTSSGVIYSKEDCSPGTALSQIVNPSALNNKITSKCAQCPADTFSNGNALACSPCADGKQSDPGSFECTDKFWSSALIIAVTLACVGGVILVIGAGITIFCIVRRMKKNQKEEEGANGDGTKEMEGVAVAGGGGGDRQLLPSIIVGEGLPPTHGKQQKGDRGFASPNEPFGGDALIVGGGKGGGALKAFSTASPLADCGPAAAAGSGGDMTNNGSFHTPMVGNTLPTMHSFMGGGGGINSLNNNNANNRKSQDAAEEMAMEKATRVALIESNSYYVGAQLSTELGTHLSKVVLANGTTIAMKETFGADESDSSEFSLITRLPPHPGIIDYYAVKYEPKTGATRVFMEFVSAQSLKAIVAEVDRPMADMTGRAFAKQILTALAFLHQHNVAHRNLLNDHILVDARGRVKIADLMTAKEVERGTDESLTIIAAPQNQPPEILTCRNMLSDAFEQATKGDIWCFGLSCVEVQNRNRGPWPVEAIGTAGILQFLQGDQPVVIPSHISPCAADFMLRCLDRNPTTRWSAEQLLSHPWMAEDSTHTKTNAALSSNPNPHSATDVSLAVNSKFAIEHVIGSGAFGTVYTAKLLNPKASSKTASFDTDGVDGADCHNRTIAVKAISYNTRDNGESTKLKKVMKEIEVMQSLDHRNIVSYLFLEQTEVGPSGHQTIYIAMEYVSGGTLKQYITDYHARTAAAKNPPQAAAAAAVTAEGGRGGDGPAAAFGDSVRDGNMSTTSRPLFGLPDIEAAYFTREMLQGLAYLHSKGFTHRDIKPSNCLLTPPSSMGSGGRSGSYPLPHRAALTRNASTSAGSATLDSVLLSAASEQQPFPIEQGIHLKLADFGTAFRAIGNETVSMNMQGTLLYMAPEIVREERPAPSADIWSLGASVMEMVTGNAPWAHIISGSSFALISFVAGTEALEMPAGLSPLCADFLQQCLVRNPRDRPTASELLHHPWIKQLELIGLPPPLDAGSPMSPTVLLMSGDGNMPFRSASSAMSSTIGQQASQSLPGMIARDKASGGKSAVGSVGEHSAVNQHGESLLNNPTTQITATSSDGKPAPMMATGGSSLPTVGGSETVNNGITLSGPPHE